MSITNTHVSDHREAKADVSGEDWMYTPAGARPIEPERIKVTYHLDKGWVFVEIYGRKRFPYNPNGRRGGGGDGLTRTFYGDAIATLPLWARAFIDQHRPERNGGWEA